MENNNDLFNFLLRVNNASILFFDMDDTLIYTNFANYLSYHKAIQKVMTTIIDIPPYDPKQRFNRNSINSFLPNLNILQYNNIIELKNQLYQNYLLETKLNIAIADVLKKYHKTNRTVLVTNSDRERAKLTLEHHKMINLFTEQIYPEKSTFKQSINKYSDAIESLEINANCVLAFENEKSEIKAANLAGIPIENIFQI